MNRNPNPPKRLPSQGKLFQPIVKVLGQLTNFDPGKGTTLEKVISGVLKEIGYDDPSDVPFRIGGARPNMKRNVYLVLWNLGVERRKGYFWTVRKDATSSKEFRLSTTTNLKGKGKVGDKKPQKKDPKQAFVWSLTWFGILQSLTLNANEKTITGLFLGKKLAKPGVRATITKKVAQRCPISADMGLEEDHVQGKFLNLMLRDGLQNQLVKNMGYGTNPSPSQLGEWCSRFGFTEIRGWGKDAAMRGICGASTETERKKIAEAQQAAEENPDEHGLPVFPTARLTVPSGDQHVNPVFQTGNDETDKPVSREFVDSNSASSEDKVIYEDAMVRMAAILAERFPQESKAYIGVMHRMVEGNSANEIASDMGITVYQARGMLDKVRIAIRQDYC